MPCRFASLTACSTCARVCFFFEPVQHFLRARLHAKRQEVAVGLAHDRQLIDRHRIHPAFAAPVELQFAFDDAVANGVDALAVDQKVIVGQVNRAIAQVVQLLQFAQDMLRRTGSASGPRARDGISQ